MKYSKEKYQAQALAVAMVILVVCTLLGISIYSRVVRDKELTVQEQSSAEALAVADLALDLIISEDLNSLLDDPDINLTLGSQVDIFTLLDPDPDPLTLCNSNTDNKSLTIDVRYMNSDDIYELRNMNTWGIDLSNVPTDGTCDSQTFNIYVDSKGQNNVGYLVQKIYESSTGERKTYKTTDKVYCFSEDGSSCNGSNFTGDVDIAPESLTVDPYDPSVEDPDFVLVEVRITAVGGTVGISHTMAENDCFSDTNFISFIANAQCSGSSRAKQVLIPQNSWAKSIFDFTLYNGVGNLTSN